MKKLFVLLIGFCPTLGCFVNDTGFWGNGGQGGGEGGGTSSSTGGDCQSGTSSSTAGSSSTGGSECANGGGGGNGGLGGIGGSGGDGGTGGSGGNLTGCSAGTEGTPDTIDSWGNDSTRVLLVKENGSHEFDSSDDGGEPNKLTFNLNTTDHFPGYMLVYGENGVHFRLKDGETPTPQDLYRLQGNISLIFPAECEELQTEGCLVRLSQWWEECGSIVPPPSGCPAIDSLPQGTSDLYDLDLDGQYIMVTTILCQP
ncbi:MAG: hypothetical protein ACRCZE_01145 [Candidatus Altimarinota bacterium]